ncbi:unnamed protein product [Rhizoctonia solani]|uniref:Uncharacterized protein n=1 Tax=Rhizoctonia solani TaxID=456999 RepID=A0A8H2ZV54_9AGAM|nr:unnamed protein product [Rhizoctonia solani]
MVIPIHHWGRPLDAYVTSYTRDKTTSRLPDSDDPQQFAIGRQMIKKICLVAHDPAVSSNISVSDLLEVLNMSRSPAGYSLFSNSRLISGCIRLMSRLPLSRGGRQAPFSYEYGYLCFRLLILALGMSLIDGREGCSQSFMQDMATYRDMEPIYLFSLCIRGIVAEHITHSAEVGDGQDIYSCVLGWLRCSECPELPELVSRSDTSTLLSMIWDDEKQFTKAMLQTYSPGLSGVVYLLWRYVQYERHLKEHPHPYRFMVPFIDVFFRCILCSTPDQALAVAMIRMANSGALQLREIAPINIRSELADSRLMIQAFIYQLNLGISTDDGETSLPIEDIPDTLHFLHSHFLPGCQDMIPELIGTTIKRCWITFLNPSRMSYFPTAFTVTFSWCRGFIVQLRQLKPTSSNKSLKLEVLTSSMDNDLIDFIGRIMVLIDPTPPKLIDSGTTISCSIEFGTDAWY